VTEARPDLPGALDGVIASALAKSPADRYATAGELLRAADAALHGTAAAPGRPRRVGFLVGAAGALVAIAAVAALVAVVLTGNGSPAPPAITPTSIAGATLGLQAEDYKALFGVGWREDVLKGPDYPVLIYFGRKLEVYFEHPGGGAVEITTWDKNFRTAAGVGPCSTIDELEHAYGNALRPSRPNTVDGKIFAYTVGHMIFAANGAPNPSKHVTAVGIYSGITLPFAGYVLLNEVGCT
jgi:hypothetical protein